MFFTSSTAKQIASSAFDLGKCVAKEGAKKDIQAGKSETVDAGKRLVEKALSPESKNSLQKYTAVSKPTHTPTSQDINTLIDGSTIAFQD